MGTIRVLFVCMGNICRSPMAEGAFARLVRERGVADSFVIDSAGTIAYHAGEAPDRRAQAEAARRGIDIGDQRARGVEPGDFHKFDYIVAMDHENMKHLRRYCPEELHHKLHLCASFAPHLETEEVPDPYYGGERGFARVLDLIEASAEGLLAHISRNHQGNER